MSKRVEEVLTTGLLDEDCVPYNTKRRHILDLLGSRLGQKPYGNSEPELVSPIGEEARIKLVTDMLSMPGDEGHRLFVTSTNLHQISDDASSHRALETMYTGPKPEADLESFLWARLFIENTHNAMAVRNRLNMVRQELRDFVGSTKSEQINVLSVAAGSSRGLLEETAMLPRPIRDRIQLKLIDISPEAGEDAKELSRQLGISDRVETLTKNVLRVNGYLEDGYKANFIEVVGLLDYLEAKHVVNLLKRLRSHLADEGMILFSNIMPNDERDFTHKIVGWLDMQYRSAEVLEELAREAGFSPRLIRMREEPLKIYNIVCAKIKMT